MMQIKCLSNGLYSLKNCHIPFGKGFQPPHYGRIPVEQPFTLRGASLTRIGGEAGGVFANVMAMSKGHTHPNSTVCASTIYTMAMMSALALEHEHNM